MKLHCDKGEEKVGMLRKKTKYRMTVRGEFTQEEINAYSIVKDEIGRHIIVEYSHSDGTELNYTIDGFMSGSARGREFWFNSVHELAECEASLKEGIKGLSTYLKKIISGDTGMGEEVTEF